MPEYHVIRAILGLAQLCTVWMIRRRDVGYLWWFGCLMFLSGAWNIAPAFPDQPFWRYWTQVPVTVGMLVLTVAATTEIFAFMRRRTFHAERMLLLDWSVVLAGLAIACSWIWSAENWYQGVMIGRQYALIGLTAGFAGAWAWVMWLRPLRIESSIRHHGDMWTLWLVCSSVLASTTKGGIFWHLFPWQGSELTWRLASDMLLFGQIWCCVGFLINLYQWHSHPICDSPTAPPDLQGLQPSLIGRQRTL